MTGRSSFFIFEKGSGHGGRPAFADGYSAAHRADSFDFTKPLVEYDSIKTQITERNAVFKKSEKYGPIQYKKF